MTTAGTSCQLPVASGNTAAEIAAGRAAFEAFTAAMKEWLPFPAPNWDKQAAAVKTAWIQAAIAARASTGN